jgi:hypothetical protein
MIVLLAPFLLSGASGAGEWESEKHTGFTLYYSGDDGSETKRYVTMLERGIASVKFFMRDNFKNEFSVYVHPSRNDLDEQWKKDWKMPEFRSECWMVASGVATKLDLLSPLRWKKEACEHDYADKDATQKVITHELFHIYHAQKNPSPDFSETQGIDWFVEGFATYASGQCDNERLKEVKMAVQNEKVPAALDDFWKGKMKYGLSGSMVMYLDHKYGRDKLKQLLIYQTKTEILGSLKISETDLLKEWADHIKKG